VCGTAPVELLPRNFKYQRMLMLIRPLGPRCVQVEAGLIQKVVEMVRLPTFQNVCMALLYHISMDDACKGMFTYTGVVPWLLECLLQVRNRYNSYRVGHTATAKVANRTVRSSGDRSRGCCATRRPLPSRIVARADGARRSPRKRGPTFGKALRLQVDDLHSAPELISLAVNLSQNPRNATVMCEGQNFMRLINRAMATKDPLLFKVCGLKLTMTSGAVPGAGFG
jgi:hypothetical protein